MTQPVTIKKKPEKKITIDDSVTAIIIVKGSVNSIRIEDEATEKAYRIQRTPVKKGLQMTGA